MKFTQEHKNKISQALRGRKIGDSFKIGHLVPREWKEKISQANKGKHFSVKTEFKKDKYNKFAFKKGHKSGMTGRKHTEETRKKLSIAHKRMKKPWARPPHLEGKNHWNWKGGIGHNRKYFIPRQEKIAGRKKPKKCEICGKSDNNFKKGLCFDHDHKTGRFRGWICPRCNLVLGLVKDNNNLLILLINYLKKYQ